MPGPTTERLDEDFRAMREEFQDFKVVLARIDARLAALDEFKADVKAGFADIKVSFDNVRANFESVRAEIKSTREDLRDEFRADLGKVQDEIKANTTSISTLEIRLGRFDGFASILKWTLTTFALAAVLGVVNISGRLISLETELRSVDRRLGGVEDQMKGVTARLDVVELGLKAVQTDLGEVKGAINRRAPDSSAELDDRIRRIARSVVDEAARQAANPKP